MPPATHPPVQSESYDAARRAPAVATLRWGRRLAAAEEGARPSLADVVRPVQPAWRVVQRLPEEAARHTTDAPVEAQAAALNGRGWGALRVVHRVRPPVVDVLGRGGVVALTAGSRVLFEKY